MSDDIIDNFLTSSGGDGKDHPGGDAQTPAEKFAEIESALFDAAASGNVTAIQLWFQLHPEALKSRQPTAPEPSDAAEPPDESKKKKEKKEPRLTPKERAFVDHYLGDCHYNGVKAAKAAGYQGSENTLAVIASQNLRKHKIRVLVEAHLAQIAMPRHEVLTRISSHARASFADILPPEVIASNPMLRYAAEHGRLDIIKKIHFDRETGAVVWVELVESQSALKMLGLHHGVFEKRKSSAEEDEHLRREQAARAVQLERCWKALVAADADPVYGKLDRVWRAQRLATSFGVSAEELLDYDLERRRSEERLLTE
jgi:hypothetical protein